MRSKHVQHTLLLLELMFTSPSHRLAMPPRSCGGVVAVMEQGLGRQMQRALAMALWDNPPILGLIVKEPPCGPGRTEGNRFALCSSADVPVPCKANLGMCAHQF